MRTPRHATEIVFEARSSARLTEFTLSEPGAGQVLVRTIVSLISTGTEMTAFNQSFAPDDVWAGYAKLPFRPGYSSVGEIVALGPDSTGLETGHRVLIERPHASHHLMDIGDCQIVPPEVSSEDAAWFALAQIAFRGFWNTEARIGGSLVVVGAGPIGQMVVRWATAAGLSRITVVDPVPARLGHAQAGGAHHTIAAGLHELTGPVHDESEEVPATYVDTTGNPSVFSEILRRAPLFGRVVLLGDAGNPSEQRLTSDVLRKSLTIAGAFGTHVIAGWTNPRVRAFFLDLASSGRFPLNGLISHRFAPDACQNAYDLLTTSRGATMGAAFTWRES